MKNSVQSIERAFQILRVAHRRPHGASISGISDETGLHTSTVSRIVSTLEEVGALERVNGSKVVIGTEIIELADHAPLTERLISIATPVMRDLTAETNEAVGLTLIEGHECVVFYQIPSTHHIQIRDWTDERFPLHVTSTGKLFLAQLSPAESAPFFAAPLTEVASKTVINPAALAAEFPQILTNRVAWTEDELEDGLISLASPIVDENDQFVAGIYMSIPSYRVQDKGRLAKLMRAAAAEISTHFGGFS